MQITNLSKRYAVQDISSKTALRRYWNSSSFKMALLFTVLLGISVALIVYFLFGFSSGDYLREAQTIGAAKIAGIVIIVLMSIVVLVSFIISRFVVSRINTIATTAHDIMNTGDLSRRISIETKWDDLSNLAQLLNRFLARNELLMEGIREVSNNIAHDLRTPLTHLRNQIEDLKSKPATETDIDALLAEADHILAIFHSLLRIANIEKGKRHQAFSEIELTDLLHDVAELYEPVAEEKNIRLSLDFAGNQRIAGDRHLLFQLFANLLDNAIKFSPLGGKVKVAVIPAKDKIFICIEDQGAGIADDEKEHVFRRFYRGDASRSTQGNGLGLSLAKAIIDLHQGNIVLEDGNPGLRVKVQLKPYQ